MRVGEAIRAAAERLTATSDTARLDAEVLMAHALGVTRSELLLGHMREPAPEGFVALIDRRAGHEPVAYITGRQEFYGLDLMVTTDTLIPRGDSETLIEAACGFFSERTSPVSILDLGTGTGALLLAGLSLWTEARGAGIDASEAALRVAVQNSQRLGMESRCEMLLRDWRVPGWSDDLGTFDLILCNPPYVETGASLEPSVRDHEPAGALYAGKEGLDEYRTLIPQLGKLKNPGGAIVLEIGATQAEAVTAIVRDSGFTIALHRDLGGRPRALVLT